MRTSTTRLGVVLAALALIATGCGRDDGGKDAGSVPGVTDEPCPNAVNKDKGCIYLGVITDLTGAFKGVGVPLTEGQKAFWAKVNADGGLGDYEVDVTKYVKDNKYDPDTHAQDFGEIEDNILLLAQSLGTAHTNGILKDAQDKDIVVLPASLGSDWIFEDGVIEVGTSYCAEAMNSVDYAVDQMGAKSVAAVHFPGDYGDDAMVGARIAAKERGLEFTDIPTGPGAEEQAAAVAAILKAKPDLVVVSTSPIELAAVVGGAAQKGFTGKFIGSIPSWNAALMQTPAAPALKALYMQATSLGTWETDSPGHQAMREAAGDMAPNDWFMAGWAGSYVTKAVLQKAIDADDLTRAGVAKVAAELDGVDSQGMLPDGSGNYAAEPNDRAVRETSLNAVDANAASGVATAVQPFVGPTAKDYKFTEACYLQK